MLTGTIIGILLLPGRALRPYIKAWSHPEPIIGILLLPGRALRQSSCHARPAVFPHRNTPPARKGITTYPGFKPRQKDVSIGILLLPGRALRRPPSWRKVIYEMKSEYSSCPEGHYDRPHRRLDCSVDVDYRNTPPARKGITTPGASNPVLLVLNIGILLLPGRALRRWFGP